MTQLVDHRGRAFNRQALIEPQTARLGYVKREWANHPSRGLTPSRLHRILEDAELGNIVAQSDLFTDMEEKDGHIFSEMSKRKRAILTLDWSIQEPSNANDAEKRETAMLREWFSDMPEFEDFILDAMDAAGHGFAAQETAWHRVGNVMLQKSFTHRPQRWFQTLMDDGNALRLRNGSAEGEELWPLGWVVHRHKARSGYLTRAGLHRTLVWPYLFKNYAVRDLAEFLEIYGLPMRVGKYPAGASDTEKSTLLAAVAGIGHNAAGIIPDGMLIEFENAAQGTHEPFQAMMDWCERTQSKVILGGTLTSQADGKSSTHALGNVHNEVRHDLMVSDARQLEGTITRDVVWPLRALNIPGANPYRSPQFRFDTRKFEDLQTLAKALPSLVRAGMQIPVNWAHEKLNIPKPQNGEAVLGVAAVAKPSAPGQPLAALSTKVSDQVAGQAASVTTPDDQAQRLARDVAPTMDAWIDRIRELVATARSLEEIRDGLLALAPSMSLDEYASAMQEALTASALAGRADILGGFGG